MSNSSFATSGLIGADFAATSTSALFAVGTRCDGNDGSAWFYVQANGAITAAYAVTIDETWQAAQVSTSNDAEGDLVGVAPVAFADNDYGWVQRAGPADVQVAASAAANAQLNTTATAGQLDDDGTTGAFPVVGLVLTTARGAGAGTAPAQLNYPVLGAALA